MKKTFLILVLTVAMYVQVISQTVNGLIVSDTNNITVVKLWGTSEERGFAYGYLMGYKLDSAFKKWVLPFYGNSYQTVRELIQQGTSIVIDTVYQNEAKAVIEGMDSAGYNNAGYDYLDILAGGIWEDMGNWPLLKKKDSWNCSAFMNWNDATAGTDLNGCSVMSHHLDWYYIPEHCFYTGSIIVHIPSEEDQQPWLMVDFAGYIAPGHGCNQSGYSMATDGLSGVGNPDTTNTSYTPFRFMMRNVLETTDYNQDGEYNMHDIREAISDQEQGYIGGSIFSALGPSTAIHDSMIALVAEVAPDNPVITFRTNSYEDTIPGDNLYAANSPIARNNARQYCTRYLAMVDTIGDGTNIGSEANWEMMRVHSNGGLGNLVFMQFIPEWSQLKLSFCRKINGTIYPAYLVEPQIFNLDSLFALPPWVAVNHQGQPSIEMNLSPNPFTELSDIRYRIPDAGFVSVRVFDFSGNEVRVLAGEKQSAGEHEVRFDASDLPAGIYIIRLQAGSESVTRKIVKL
jgi:hypothetical protein